MLGNTIDSIYGEDFSLYPRIRIMLSEATEHLQRRSIESERIANHVASRYGSLIHMFIDDIRRIYKGLM